MSYIVGKSAYKSLEERLDRLPIGAPPSETLYRILELLFSEKEAALVAQLPIKPFKAEMAAKIWKVSPVNSVHRVVQQAILKLPPVQKTMASKQLKSIYLEKLILAKGIK